MNEVKRNVKIGVNDLLEVKLNDPENDFLVIKETLSRIGIPSRKDNRLFQSCHILHKRGKYYIVHFKELFALDGKPVNFDSVDQIRRNKIASILDEWELCEIINRDKFYVSSSVFVKDIKIVSHKEITEGKWKKESKYNIGKYKKGDYYNE